MTIEPVPVGGGIVSSWLILCWVGLGQERRRQGMGMKADLQRSGCFWSSIMHSYLCLYSVYLLFIFVSSSPNPSSWLWHVLHCLVLDMSFVLTFALRIAIWSIISCFLILALPSSHLPSGCSTLLLALQPHIHNYVVPYTAGGFVISLENKDAMCIKALVLILPSKALDKFFGTISSYHHHFLQKVCVMYLHGALHRVAEFAKWVQRLPSRNL